MLKEEWKIIDGYSRYIISNTGEVKNLKTGRILKKDSSRNYYEVVLSKNGKTKKYSIHRLVAEAFIPNPENKPQVNHKDGNKLNNNLDNLEWCTTKENAEHARDILKISYNTENAHEARKIKINVLNENKEIIQTFNSINECANFYNIKYQTIQYYLKTQTIWKKQKIFFETT